MVMDRMKAHVVVRKGYTPDYPSEGILAILDLSGITSYVENLEDPQVQLHLNEAAKHGETVVFMGFARELAEKLSPPKL